MEMIEFQGQDIQRIDDDVSDIENNLSAGLTELQTTYNNSSNKMLMMKIFGIFMAFMVIFILFFAWRGFDLRQKIKLLIGLLFQWVGINI